MKNESCEAARCPAPAACRAIPAGHRRRRKGLLKPHATVARARCGLENTTLLTALHGSYQPGPRLTGGAGRTTPGRPELALDAARAAFNAAADAASRRRTTALCSLASPVSKVSILPRELSKFLSARSSRYLRVYRRFCVISRLSGMITTWRPANGSSRRNDGGVDGTPAARVDP